MPSILNGLSALGQGISQFAGAAGLELQKSQLQNQAAILADQLATTRETTLQGQRQAGAAALQGQSQTFQGSQNDLTRQSTASIEAAREAAAMARTKMGEDAAMARLREGYAHPAIRSELDYLNTLNPDGTPKSGAAAPATGSQGGDTVPATGGQGGAPAAVPTSSTDDTWDGSAPAPAPSIEGSGVMGSAGGGAGTQKPNASDAGAADGGAPTSASVPSFVENLRNKAMGIPVTGSPQRIAYDIAQGVLRDHPYWPADKRAAETATRLAVAEGKMPSQADSETIAAAQATYALSPLDQRARMATGGPAVTAKMLANNPKYNETQYDAIKEAQKAIAPGGTLAVPISAMNTSMGHAAHFLDVATQLGNYSGGNWANIFPNAIAKNTGNAPLINALSQTAYAMSEEGNRIYAGNAGAQSAIDTWYKSFPVNGSLADQVGAVKNFAQLMGDKFDVMTGMVNKTFTDSGIPPVDLLLPKSKATYERLINMGPDGKPATKTAPASPAIPSWAQPGDLYNPGLNKARRPDGTLYGPPQ